MSDLRDAQQQLIIREKMASLGDLVAGVAHEVNTPIGAVNSSADVTNRCIEKIEGVINQSAAADELKTSQPYQQAIQILKDNAGLIRSAGERIATIVRSLRSFARLDEAEYQSADIHIGLDSTLDLVNHELRNRVEVVKEYGDLPMVDCFPNKLNQVFMNLLINASQAIEGSGTILLSTELAGDTVVIRIADSGKGISPENLGKVFNPGFTTKGVGVGTGLGLAISYTIIEDHRGSITAKSELGRGTTFTIRLPIKGETQGR
jgi:two-component system NtrC family sensor kinase